MQNKEKTTFFYIFAIINNLFRHSKIVYIKNVFDMHIQKVFNNFNRVFNTA